MRCRGVRSLLVLVLVVAPASAAPRQIAVPRLWAEGPPLASSLEIETGPVSADRLPTAWELALQGSLGLMTPDALGMSSAITAGIEGWASEGNGGAGLPIGIALGAHARPLAATIGGGFDVLRLDHVAGETSLGFVALFASARVGIVTHGFTVAIEARRTWAPEILGDGRDHVAGLLVLGLHQEALHR